MSFLNKPVTDRQRIFDDSSCELVTVVAHPHEYGGGYSYTISMGADGSDPVHFDTKQGTVFTAEECLAIRAYWRLMRAKGDVRWST